jgi:hypothetical protein
LISEAIQKCLKNGIKVYPVNVGFKIYIEAEINGKKKRFPKQVSGKEINEALAKTYKHYSEKL